jgi:laminin alpha 1/2
VEGRNCDRCKPGTFHLEAGKRAGCSACFCSGVTEECSEARLYWSTLRLAFYDEEHGVVLAEAAPVQRLSGKEVTYLPDSYELSYREQPSSGVTYYWLLPPQFTGSKTTAYGGNLTIIQRYTAARGREADPPLGEPVVIIRSGGGLTLRYGEENLERSATAEEQKYKVGLVEEGWTVREEEGGEERPATRQDLLRALADIEASHAA